MIWDLFRRKEIPNVSVSTRLLFELSESLGIWQHFFFFGRTWQEEPISLWCPAATDYQIETINTFIHSRSTFPRNYLIPDPDGQSLYPFSDQNNAKPLPFGVAHTYVAYIREYPLGESNGMLTEKVGERFNLHRSVVMTCHIWRHTT